MDNEKNNPASAKGDQAEIQKKLDQMAEELKQVAGKRKVRATISVIGLILIICAIALFVIQLVGYYQNFDYDVLLQSARAQAKFLSESQEVRDIVKEAKTNFLPAYRAAVIKEFNKEMPQFNKAIETTLDNLEKYLNTTVKDRIAQQLTDSLVQVEKQLLENYKKQDIPPEKISQVIEEGKKNFMNEVAKVLEKRLAQIQLHLADLQANFDVLKQDPKYKKLLAQPSMAGDVQSRMVETLLELCIYNLNDERGNQPEFPAKMKRRPTPVKKVVKAKKKVARKSKKGGKK